MKQLTLSTVCMIAALAAVPAIAAPAGKTGDQRPANDTECTYENTGKSGNKAKARRDVKPMDCIVVKGYPNQDGRAVLRRSLERDAKTDLSKTIRPTLKDIFKVGRTS